MSGKYRRTLILDGVFTSAIIAFSVDGDWSLGAIPISFLAWVLDPPDFNDPKRGVACAMLQFSINVCEPIPGIQDTLQ